MIGTLIRRDYHESIGYVFMAAFVLALVFMHFLEAPRALVYVCVVIEAGCVILFALWRRWLLLVSGIGLIYISMP